MHSAIIVADLNGRIFQWLDRSGPSIFLRGLPRPGSSEDKVTVCIVMVLLLTLDMKRQSRTTRLFCPFSSRNPGAHAPVGPRRERVGVGRCGFEAGRVADGAGHTWPAPRRGRAGPAEHAPREGGALPP